MNAPNRDTHIPAGLDLLADATLSPAVAALVGAQLAPAMWPSAAAEVARWLAGWLADGGAVGPEATDAQRASWRAALGPQLVAAWEAVRDGRPAPTSDRRADVAAVRARHQATEARALAAAIASAAERGGPIAYRGTIYPADDGLPAAIQAATAAYAQAIGPATDAPGPRRLGAFIEAKWAQEAADRRAGIAPRPPVTTGLRALDAALGGGLRPGQLVVIGGRPGMGKTSLAMGIGVEAAMHGRAVGMISLEMTGAELDARAISLACAVPQRVVLDERLATTDEWSSVLDVLDAFRASTFYIDDRPARTLPQVVATARTWAAGGLDVLIIDYLGLMRLPDAERHAIAIGQVTSTLKAVAKELRCAVVCLSQMNRDIERRGTSARAETGDWRRDIARPTLADLRDSGSIEQDADVVMFPLRPIGKLATPRNAHDAMIDIVKNRAGAPACVDVAWDGPCSAFRDLPDDTTADDLLP